MLQICVLLTDCIRNIWSNACGSNGRILLISIAVRWSSLAWTPSLFTKASTDVRSLDILISHMSFQTNSSTNFIQKYILLNSIWPIYLHSNPYSICIGYVVICYTQQDLAFIYIMITGHLREQSSCQLFFE